MSDSNQIKTISQILVFENFVEQTNFCVPDIVDRENIATDWHLG